MRMGDEDEDEDGERGRGTGGGETRMAIESLNFDSDTKVEAEFRVNNV